MNHQTDGFVLPVGMIFLIILSLLSISALKDVVLEEKMTSNYIDKQISFERAESALMAIQRFDMHQNIDDIRNMAGFNNSKENPSGAPDFGSKNHSWNNGFVVSEVKLGALTNQAFPTGILEEIASTESLKVGKEPVNPETAERHFRVTVNATGHTSSATTTLQGVIKR